jgi:Flp pilus assembly protein TadB
MRISIDEEFPRSSGNGPRRTAPGPLAKALTWVVAAVALAGALVLSAALFAVLLVVGAAVGGRLWWQTRALRRRLRERMQQMEAAKPGAWPPDAGRSGGEVIEGDFIRETKP